MIDERNEAEDERCAICCTRLGSNPDNWGEFCPECADVMSELLDATGLDDPWAITVAERVRRFIEIAGNSPRHAPTYYGSAYPELIAAGILEEYGRPHVPVSLETVEGLRVRLGEGDAPFIDIERRPAGWVIHLHTQPAGDPSGFIFILDDGRTFAAPEPRATPPLAHAEYDDIEPKIDRVPHKDQAPHRAAPRS